MSQIIKELFEDDAKRELLKKFCEKENSLENFFFLKDIRTLQSTDVPFEIKLELAKAIMYEYMFSSGNYRLNIDEQTVSKTAKKFQEIVHSKTKSIEHMFDDVVLLVENVMMDTLSRFLACKEYQDYLAQEANGEKPKKKPQTERKVLSLTCLPNVKMSDFSRNLKKLVTTTQEKLSPRNKSPTYKISKNCYGQPLVEEF